MVFKKLRSVLGKPEIQEMPLEFAGGPPAPERPFYAIGDLHGRIGLLEPLLERIDADMISHEIEDPVLVFLGDYVDRGDQSAAVLAHVREMVALMPDNIVCLMGNHERMMLDFIDDPIASGAFWLRHGGVQTLESFGIEPFDGEPSADDLVEAAALLSLEMPDGTEDWLRALPLRWTSGNVSCVHAGMDPLRPPTRQSDQVLLWGHPDFAEVTRLDKHWVVHGHTTVEKPLNRYGRISIDTGAWRTGELSAVAITGGAPRFL